MKEKKRQTRGKVSRREFLKAGVAGLGVAAMGGLTGKAFGAPAVIKGTKLTILQGTYFIAPGQELYKKQAQEWGQANGVTMSADFLNWPDLQPKIAAAIQGGGVDIVELWPGWNYLYKNNLVDMTTEAEEFGKRGGGFEKYVLNSAPVGGRYLGIPHGYSNGSMNYRISWFKEAGCPNAEDGNKVDLTWDEYHAIAKKCKAQGIPSARPWATAPAILQDSAIPTCGPTGPWRSPRTGSRSSSTSRNSWKACGSSSRPGRMAMTRPAPPGTTATTTGRSCRSRSPAPSTAPASTLRPRRTSPSLPKTSTTCSSPKGLAGRFYWLESRTFAILKNSKNIAGAKEFLKWWFQDKQFGDWWRLQEGYMLQPVVKYYNDPTWFKDPKMSPFREQPKYGINMGYAGPPNEKAALAWSKYIVIDTFAKAVQSGDAKASIEWGAEQLKRSLRCLSF